MKIFFICLLVIAIVAAIIACAVKFIMMAKKGICPICVLEQYTKPKKITMELPEEDYSNGVALTPPMGWSSWNTFRQKIDEDIIRDTAKAMKDSGLLEAGYQYLNLDDCWQSSLRDEKGRLQGDLTNFPSGIPQLVKDVNEMGIKLGIYTSNGTLTCEDLPASLGTEKLDALTFAVWGIEFFKYDFCHNEPIPAHAPFIEGISVGKAGTKGNILQYAKDAVLDGRAKIIKDKSLPSGEYIGFLGNGSGKAKFIVEVPEDGAYVLTILLRKAIRKDKYLQIWVNGKDLYEQVFSKTKAWSATGRQQIIVKLRQGANEISMFNPVKTKADSSFIQYSRMGKELKWATAEVAKKTGKSEKPIVYSLCEWGRNCSWNWGAKAGNMWRTTPDIVANWKMIMYIYERTVRLNEHSKPGAWNDPDMLEVGNGKLTKNENKAHFSLWCMMNAPLILGNDLRKFLNDDGTVDTENDTLKIVTNKELIAINQDKLGVQAVRVKKSLKYDILAKPLENGNIAICFIQKMKGNKDISFDIEKLNQFDMFNVEGEYNVHEIWSGEEQKTQIIRAAMKDHSCKVYIISK